MRPPDLRGLRAKVDEHGKENVSDLPSTFGDALLTERSSSRTRRMSRDLQSTAECRHHAQDRHVTRRCEAGEPKHRFASQRNPCQRHHHSHQLHRRVGSQHRDRGHRGCTPIVHTHHTSRSTFSSDCRRASQLDGCHPSPHFRVISLI